LLFIPSTLLAFESGKDFFVVIVRFTPHPGCVALFIVLFGAQPHPLPPSPKGEEEFIA
jgi:hypothetical protein